MLLEPTGTGTFATRRVSVTIRTRGSVGYVSLWYGTPSLTELKGLNGAPLQSPGVTVWSDGDTQGGLS